MQLFRTYSIVILSSLTILSQANDPFNDKRQERLNTLQKEIIRCNQEQKLELMYILRQYRTDITEWHSFPEKISHFKKKTRARITEILGQAYTARKKIIATGFLEISKFTAHYYEQLQKATELRAQGEFTGEIESLFKDSHCEELFTE